MSAVETPPPPNPKVVGLVWIAGAAVLLLALPIFLVRFLFTREWLEAKILPGIETAVGRDIDFERLRIGVRGIVLEKLTVAENPSFVRSDHREFATLERLVLGVRWLALLKGRVVIESVSLDDPVVVFERSPAGAINFADSPLLAPDSSERIREAERDADSGRLRVLRLDATRVRVHNGRIVWIDGTADGVAARLELRRVYLSANDVTTTGPFIVRGSMELSPGPGLADSIEIAANVDVPASSTEIVLAAGSIDASAYAAALEAAHEGVEEDAAADSAAATGPPPATAPSRRGDGEPATAGGILKATVLIEELGGFGANLDALNVVVAFRDGKLAIPSFEMGLGGGSLWGDADGDWSSGKGKFHLSLHAENVALTALETLVHSQVPFLRSLGGTLDASLLWRGGSSLDFGRLVSGGLPGGQELTLESLAIESAVAVVGEPGASGIALTDVRAQAKDCHSAKRCSFEVAGNFLAGAAEPASFELGGLLMPSLSSLDWEGDFGRLDAATLVAAWTAPPAVVAELAQDATTLAPPHGEQEGGEMAPVPTAKHEPKPTAAPIRARGKLRATSARLAGVEMTPFFADLDYEKSVLVVKSLSGGAGGGTLAARGRADFAKGPIEAKLRLERADIPSVAATIWSPAWGSIAGLIGVDADARTDLEDWRANLRGSATVTIDGGRWTGGPFLDAIAAAVSMPSLTELELAKSGGKIAFADGRVASERLLLGGEESRIVAKGSVGWDGNVDLRTTVGLAEEPAETGDAYTLEWKKERDGWHTLALTVEGSVWQPAVAPASAASRQTPDR